MKLLVTVPVLLLNYMGGCGDKPVPAPAGTTFRVVAYQQTVTAQGLVPRTRWIVETVPLDSVPGFSNRKFTRIKAFDLGDTLLFRPGYQFKAQAQLIDYAQQTPWKTRYEWRAVPAQPPGYTPNPEMTLTAASSL